MKILILQPICYHGKKPHHYMPPLGIAYLAAVLIKNGIDNVKLIDFYSEELWENKEDIISSFSPDIVGISCMTTNFPEAVKVAKFCKENLNCLVVYGGSHASGSPTSCLLYGYGDVAVMGYAEKSFLELCKAYKSKDNFDNVPNIYYKKDGKILYTYQTPNFSINELPQPKRELLDIKFYPTYFDSPTYGRIDANTIEASRGCNYKCIFCTSSLFSRWQGKNPKLICDEIEEIQHNYGKEGLFFYDLLFTCEKQWIIELCNEMINRGLNKLKWYAMGRTNVVDKETLNLMKEAGCVLISYGFESLHDVYLKKLNKSQTLEDIERTLNLTNEAGISPMAHFIIGLPNQTENDLLNDLEIIKSWIKKYNLYAGDFYPMMMFPGTKLFKDFTKYHNHNWLDEVSPDFIFPNVPVYTDSIPLDRLLQLSNYLNKECRKLLAKVSNIYNVEIRSRKKTNFEIL